MIFPRLVILLCSVSVVGQHVGPSVAGVRVASGNPWQEDRP
jgi:hypothetical protein